MLAKERDRRRATNILRATPIAARSMYAELMRADYALEDVLRFVNHLLANAADARSEVSVEHEVDPETGLLSPAATRSVLGFECRRANASLAIACIEIRGSSEARA